jgi:hypothetical protein
MQEVSLTPPATIEHLKARWANGYRMCRYNHGFYVYFNASVTYCLETQRQQEDFACRMHVLIVPIAVLG